jgi:hypothetical protein
MKVDQDIIDAAYKEGMPQKPMRENFKDDESFEEHYGYWMSHYGRVLVFRQMQKDAKNK